jgi:hypothetical protein
MNTVFASSPQDDAPPSQFIAKVFKIDGHNVITAGDMQGNLRYLSFAYITTPIRGQSYFAEIQQELSQYVGQWLHFTVVPYGRNMQAQASLVRTDDNMSLNAHLIREGFAKIKMATKPPVSLVEQAKTAAENKKGMWSEVEQFSENRLTLSPHMLAEMFNHKDKNGLVPYILDEATMLAHPIICQFLDSEHDYPVAVTKHVANRKGYTTVDVCPEMVPPK